MAHTFVLVHGAWHGGWCWERVAAALLKEGHRVYAPTLSGVGERSHLADKGITLTTHALDVVNEVLWKDLSGIVLCGHSYGGMVITAAAEKLAGRIASIVYVDAFLPQNGQSLDDMTGAALPLVNGLAAPFSAESFKVNPKDQAWVNAKMTPQSGTCFAERVSLTGALERIPKKAYVLAAQYPQPGFRATYERLARDPAWQTYAIEAGHDLMIDAPRELTEVLLRAA